MRIKQDYVSNQFHQMYFEISSAEMDNIFSIVYEENADLVNSREDILLEAIKEEIEFEVIAEEIDNLDVYMVGPKMIKYLTKIEKGKPLLGIAQFCILPENLDLELPTYVPKNFLSVSTSNETIEKTIKKILLKHDYFQTVPSQTVNIASIVTYDLLYKKDDFLINTIKNQTFDMTSDSFDIDATKFVGKKVRDKIILDEDDIKVIAQITKIEEKVADMLSEEIVRKLRFSRVITVEGFKKKVKETIEFGKLLDLIVYYLTEFIIQSKQLVFDDYVINFYHRFKDNLNLANDKVDYNLGVQRMLIIEYLSSIIDLKNDSDRVKHINKIEDEQILANLLDGDDLEFAESFFERRVQELKILNYCLEQNIIDIKI
ncbi:MAG TPA: hypothetical protein VJZ51_06235 [Bacilli bacterium]|nr:hypothetical protein [Bacilli bacterium]